jgi:hypothetical protein
MSKKLEQAKQILEAEEKRISEVCAKEIEAVLKKYNRTFATSGEFTGNKIDVKISIIKNGSI